MFNYHLSGGGEHQDLNYSLGRVLAEHFTNSTPTTRDNAWEKTGEEFCIHCMNGSAGDFHDQTDACKCDHYKDDDRECNFYVARNVINDTVKVFADFVVYMLLGLIVWVLSAYFCFV